MFTDAQIRRLKAKETPYKVYEKGSDKGFHVQVTRTGQKVFYLAYILNGKKRFFKLGTYSTEFGLAEARKACRAARSIVESGADPQLEQRDRIQQQEDRWRAVEAEQNAVSVNVVLDAYIDSLGNVNTRKNTEWQFKADVRGQIGQLKAHDLTRQDVQQVIHAVIKRGANRSARNLYSALNAAFEKAIQDPDMGLSSWDNPLKNVQKPPPGNPSDRTLTVEEIHSFWTSLDQFTGTSEPFKDALRLLLITGQRVREILEMRWTEVDLKQKTIDIPPERIKTGRKTRRGHVVPITPMAEEILKRQPGQGKAVFPGRMAADTPFNWQSLTTALARLLKENDHLPSFSPRDLRRTVKTHMARIKVMKEVRDRIQNHALNDVASTHYDRHDYLDEKRDGLERWESELRRIINGR